MRAPAKQPEPISELARRCGLRIFCLRTKKGWSQREVARRARMSLAYLCDVENGKRRVGAEKLYRIAKVFGVSMDSFFEKGK